MSLREKSVLEAPAKLTLSLRVVGRRPDGVHLLEAEMASLVGLADVLEFDDGEGLEVVWDAPHGEEAMPPPEDNIVLRTLSVLKRTAAIRLTKRIPVGAGLGGGSADAAAVLRWAGIDPKEGRDRQVMELARSLGSDVPFCLVGGRAIVEGTGEKVTPKQAPPQLVALVSPPYVVSTAAVYQAWDELGGPHGEGPNDLEPAALLVEPRLAYWRDALKDATGRPCVLAGSGSSWFAIIDDCQEKELQGLEISSPLGKARILVVTAAGSSGKA